MSTLLSPATIRGITFRNRIVVSPMCEYSSVDGFANDWHLVHLGSRAVGGAGLVLTEAAAVTADGRISPVDLGIYRDEHVEPLARIFRFVETHGAVPGMQLAHAGRKASTAEPWKGGAPVPTEDGGWTPVWAPSAIPFREGWQTPRAMSSADIAAAVGAFAKAAERLRAAGGQVAELPGAVCQSNPPRNRHPDRRCRPHHRARSGRSDPARRSGGHDRHGAPASPRSVLADPRRAGARRSGQAARAISPGVLTVRNVTVVEAERSSDHASTL